MVAIQPPVPRSRSNDQAFAQAHSQVSAIESQGAHRALKNLPPAIIISERCALIVRPTLLRSERETGEVNIERTQQTEGISILRVAPVGFGVVPHLPRVLVSCAYRQYRFPMCRACCHAALRNSRRRPFECCLDLMPRFAELFVFWRIGPEVFFAQAHSPQVTRKKGEWNSSAKTKSRSNRHRYQGQIGSTGRRSAWLAANPITALLFDPGE